MVEFSHFILTRFNVPFLGRWSSVTSEPRWQIERMRLFERYCLPSVKNQASQDFGWLIYADANSADDVCEKLDHLAATCSQAEILWCSGTQPDPVTDISSRLNDEVECVLTTRLDNDDAIHRQFVLEIQDAARKFQCELPVVFNFPMGLAYREPNLYRHVDRSNAFTTLVEKRDHMKTIWFNQHQNLGKIVPVIQLGTEARWLQGLHSRNLSNRIKGRRVSTHYLDGFELNVEPPDADGTHRLFIFNVLVYPLIWLRERIIVVIKFFRG